MKLSEVISKGIVSLFGVGYIRPASATWGSFASGILLYFYWPELDLQLKILLIIGVFILGTFLSDYLEKSEGLHDPYFIVIDEGVVFVVEPWAPYAELVTAIGNAGHTVSEAILLNGINRMAGVLNGVQGNVRIAGNLYHDSWEQYPFLGTLSSPLVLA